MTAAGRCDYEENRFQSPQAIASAGIVVDWNLYDGGRSRHAATAELTRAAKLERLAADLKSRIELEVLTQWNYLVDSEARIALAGQAVQQAEELLRVSQLRFDEDITVGSAVLEARTGYHESISEFYRAGYNLSIARLRLQCATGSLGFIK
jgi:outer membrane protein TolC